MGASLWQSCLSPYLNSFRFCRAGWAPLILLTSTLNQFPSRPMLGASRSPPCPMSPLRVSLFLSNSCYPWGSTASKRSEEHTSELQSHSDLVCRLLLEKKKQ